MKSRWFAPTPINGALIYSGYEDISTTPGYTLRIGIARRTFDVSRPSPVLFEMGEEDHMRRSWYSINETNNTFYLYDPATTSIINEFTIAPGTYSSFVDLASAIQAALQASYPPATCAYDAITRKFALLSPL